MLELITNDTQATNPEMQQTLDELTHQGARRMIAEALELEVAEYIRPVVSPARRARPCPGGVNGQSRQCTLTLGAGPVTLFPKTEMTVC